MSTDIEWEKWGLQDPYFSVLTNPKFRRGEMTAEAKQDFFFSGRYHVDQVMSACRRFIDPEFTPERVLDFGCGVGRLVLPFATIAREVVGVDISEAMLTEARLNCAEEGIRNAVFVKSDDSLSAVDGVFDLVHTAIVLQHIDAHRGTKLVAQLLDRLAPNGIGAVQLTYAKAYHAATLGAVPPVAPPPAVPPIVAAAKSTPWLRRLFGRSASAAQAVSPPATPASGVANEPAVGGPAKDPEMQMNPYDLNVVLYLMQTAGITDLRVEFTDHGGELGVFMYFRKP